MHLCKHQQSHIWNVWIMLQEEESVIQVKHQVHISQQRNDVHSLIHYFHALFPKYLASQRMKEHTKMVWMQNEIILSIPIQLVLLEMLNIHHHKFLHILVLLFIWPIQPSLRFLFLHILQSHSIQHLLLQIYTMALNEKDCFLLILIDQVIRKFWLFLCLMISHSTSIQFHICISMLDHHLSLSHLLSFSSFHSLVDMIHSYKVICAYLCNYQHKI